MNRKQLPPPVAQGEGCVTSAEGTLEKAVLVAEGGAHYAVNPNAIFTVNCTAACNAKCFFCYNNSTFMRSGDSVDADAPELLRAIRFARKGGIQRAALSGGEPTLQPEALLALAARLKEGGFSTIRLHTNGALLDRSALFQGVRAPLWAQLRAAGVTDLSISLADCRTDSNFGIMGLDTLRTVEDLLPRLQACGLRVRLSCYLCPQGVHSADDVRGYVEWGNARGVREFILRLSPDLPDAGERMARVEAALREDGWRLLYAHDKSDSQVREYARGEGHISISCASEEPDGDRKIRRLIYMPDKVVYTSWIDPASYLFDGDEAKIAAAALARRAERGFGVPEFIHRAEGHDIDLHVHSMVSDGLCAPTEVVRRAAEAGVRKMVFAEHNCLHDSPLLLRAAARELGVELPLFGVEFSTVYCESGAPRLKFHMLVYAQEPGQLDFMRELLDPNEARNAHIRGLYAAARRAGAVDAPLEEIYRIDDDRAPTRKKMLTRSLLAAAIARKLGCTAEEAKANWLPNLPDAQRYAQYIDSAALVRLAHAHGCAAVLAHPGWIRPYSGADEVGEAELFRAIVSLARDGLDGVEVVHRLNGAEMREKLYCLAQHLDLIVTGGSDYHGKPRCVLGVNGTREEDLARLERRIGELRGRIK